MARKPDADQGAGLPTTSQEVKCSKCGLPVADDANRQWTPTGYEHADCPIMVRDDLHPSGFTKKQVYYSQLLVKHILMGKPVRLIKCVTRDEKEVTCLCLLDPKGNQVGVVPIAIMFEGDGTDEVQPVLDGDEDPPEIRGRKLNG